MIKIENIKVYNISRAVYSARNAMNSWDKSDSDLEHDILGEADLALARKLCRAGSDHRKFLRQIMVTVDITAPLYWWKEADQYKVGTTTNSCSTMHRIHTKDFVPDDFSHDRIAGEYLESLNLTIGMLNYARRRYLETSEKCHWDAMIQLLPSSYNQRRTVTLNYEVLFNMYNARLNHRLNEWRKLCEVIETMPYAKELICDTEKIGA